MSGFPTNKVSFQLIYSFIFETGRKYFKYYKYFYNSLEKVEKRLRVSQAILFMEAITR